MTITDHFCQLCLEPEKTGDSSKSLQFVRNICYCKDGRSNMHRKCLVEWTTKSGAKNCHRCQCRYGGGSGGLGVTFVPRSLPDYIWNFHEEWVKLAHKLLRQLNSLHITLLVLYTLAFVSLSDAWLPYKPILVILAIVRSIYNFKSFALFGRDLMRNYRRWKLSYFTVVFDDDDG